jgi:Gas vesicle synthesis protein GvpL/GvpF
VNAARAKYVYGVVLAGTPLPSVTGVGRSGLNEVRGDGVAAIVSDLPGGGSDAHSGEAHARVLERALEQGSVLPLRPGCTLPDDRAVREQLLAPFERELLSQLLGLEGKVELHVRASYVEEALMREIVESHPGIAGRSEAIGHRPADATYYDQIELEQLVAEAVGRARELDTAAIVHALQPLAVACRAAEPPHELVAAQLSFLVGRPQLPSFAAAVAALARQQLGRLALRCSGPLPAYSFVELPQAY